MENPRPQGVEIAGVRTNGWRAGGRSWARSVAAVLVGALLAATPLAGSATAAPLSALESDVLTLTNAARAAGAQCGGVLMPPAPALAWSDQLASISLGHSTDMATRNFFDHLDPDGVGPFDRMTRAGYTYSAAGENIAVGYLSAAAVVAGWLASPGHCRNIMSQSFTELGVGYHPGTTSLPHLWTQSFGARSIDWQEPTTRGAGQSAAPQPSTTVTPVASQAQVHGVTTAQAGAPTASAAMVTRRKARITWTADPTAKSYRVRVVGPSGKGKWHRTTKLARTFSGLRPATAYRFQLVSGTGAGPVVELPFTTS